MASELTPFQLTICKQLFKEITGSNINGGEVTEQDLAEFMRGIGQNPTNAEVRELMRKIKEGDQDATFSLGHFVTWLSRQKTYTDSKEDLMLAFGILDPERRGYISAKRLQYALMRTGDPMTREEAEEVVAEADVDSNGKINYEEFVNMMTK